ncbi:MAG TPA: proton-conducting transporter membrane subunit [Chloroflexota bacterium]|nr:proton-conducting transporter membrane subunit [Chloroflexota bacterium]
MSPLILVVIPLVGAFFAALNEPKRLVHLAILTPIVEFVALWLTSSQPSSWLGLGLEIRVVERFALAIIILAVAPALLAAGDEWPGGEGTALGLVGLAAGVVAIATSQSVVASTVASLIAAAVLTPILVGENSVAGALPRTTRACLAWLALAGSMLLVSSALEGHYGAQPMPGLLQPAAAFLVVGLGIFVAAFPFSLWLPSLADGAPSGSAMVLGILGTTATATLAATLDSSTWLATAFSIRAALATSGGIAAVFCSLLALGEKRPGRIIALLLSANSDLALAGAVSISPDSLVGVIWLLAVQFLVAALALTALASCQGKVNGLLGRRPILALGLAIAAWSLVGAPPTAGFTGRLILAQSVAPTNLPLLLEDVVASVLGGFAILPLVATLLRGCDDSAEPVRPVDVAILIVAAIVIVGGLFPNPVLAPLQAALAG